MAARQPRAPALFGQGRVVFEPHMAGLQLEIRRIDGTLTQLAHKMKAVNQKVVMEMAADAAKRLEDDKVMVRPEAMRSGRLKRAVLNPASHVVTYDGFIFLDNAKMREQVIYWRLIERGTRIFVGRPRHFLFYSGRTGRLVKPNARRRGQDTVVVDAQNPDASRLRIKTPIEPHRYADYAVRRFQANRYARYKGLAAEAAASVGLPLRITS